jgi:sterol desaturase/sphingolipid hydroxylase (fatty acid hydroxylase superfamily)
VIIALSIPGFFVLLFLEAFLSWRLGRRFYRLHDAVSDLACGTGSRMFGLLQFGALFAVYVGLYESARVTTLGDAWWVWVAAFVAVDFIYYWWHRASHRVNALWAAHVVHHQSEDYNLAVALRQAWFTSFTSFFFYLPLAILGVSPLIYATCSAINTVYQFWIHTRFVGKLGPIEWIMNTPSHHRVHHGTEAKYIDKNHAGVFIIWDRMFGTFIEEDEEPVYGTLHHLRSFDPIWANFHTWAALFRTSAALFQAGRFLDAALIFVRPPEWGVSDADMAAARAAAPYDPPPRPRTNLYVLAQFALALGGGVYAIFFASKLAPAALIALVVWVVASTSVFAAFFHRRRSAVALELARLAAALPLILWLSPAGARGWLWPAALAWVLGSALVVSRVDASDFAAAPAGTR